MESAYALGSGPGVEGGDVAEAHDPGGVGAEGGGIEQREEPSSAVATPEGPYRTDRRVAEGGVESGSAVGVGAAEGTVAGAGGGWREHGREASGADGGGGGFPSGVLGEAGGRDEGDGVAGDERSRQPKRRGGMLKRKSNHEGKFVRNLAKPWNAPPPPAAS